MPAHSFRQVAIRDWRPSNAIIIDQEWVHDSAHQCHFLFFLVFVKCFEDVGIVVRRLHMAECALGLLWRDRRIWRHVGRTTCVLHQNLLGIARLLLRTALRVGGVVIYITYMIVTLRRRNVAPRFEDLVQPMRQALSQDAFFLREFPS